MTPPAPTCAKPCPLAPLVGTLTATGTLPAFITLNGDKLEAKPEGNDFGSYSFSIHDAVGKVMDLTMDVPRPSPAPTFSPTSGMTLTFAATTSNDVDVTITPACTYTAASATFINTPPHWNQAQISIVQQFPMATDAQGHLTVSAKSHAGISTGTATLELLIQSKKPGEPPITIDIPVKLE